MGRKLLERARAEGSRAGRLEQTAAGRVGELQRSRGQEGRANGRNLRELIALTPECSTAVCRRPAKDAAFTPRLMSQRKGLRSHEACGLRAEGLEAGNTQRARASLAQVSGQVSARQGSSQIPGGVFVRLSIRKIFGLHATASARQ